MSKTDKIREITECLKHDYNIDGYEGMVAELSKASDESVNEVHAWFKKSDRPDREKARFAVRVFLGGVS